MHKQRFHTRTIWLAMVLFFILASCGPQRDNRLLVVFDGTKTDPSVVSALMEKQEALVVDTLSFDPVRRPGATLLPYRAVWLLADPMQVPVEWQSDIERYVQSGGGLQTLDMPVNKFHWPWLWRAREAGEPGYDGGQVAFVTLKALADAKISMGSDKIRESAIHSQAAPDQNRFTKIILDADVNEPMELALLPSGRVLYIEREGNLKVYDPKRHTTKLLHTFDVSTEGNYEDGMLGLAADPNYKENNWIYIYYSPYGGRPRQNLSRFVLAYEDSLIVSSEKVVLEVAVQRETCCHSGGSINFGPDGNLYLSTGDNTSSKESDGYSPLDERPGRSPFDAQKSSGNANDLRGKILRITPTADGSYTIPEGNLFPEDGKQGRPEIYTMGCRNPFRFTVDQRTGFVYWGDVGPDSGKDSELGPQSYDEWNQARKAGNYGWPYFVGDNKAYPDFDFATGEIGPAQDPGAPENHSPNNTGPVQLPPAQLPLIWYPYGESAEWPMLGTGSRSAMSGPMYYRPKGKSRVAFPDYYEGKLFIYEWARSWIKVVSFDKDWNLEKIEPFLPNETFVKPIDMEFGEDGALYMLEYGENYFANNVEARLVKIEYAEGNRLPVPAITADKTRGAVPFTVNVSSQGSFDYDAGDSLTFSWLANDQSVNGKTGSFTFTEPGNYPIKLTVSDSQGDTASAILVVTAGNEPPVISLEYSGNLSFYFGRETTSYRVVVKDKEDGSTLDGGINPADVRVSFNYLERGFDLALLGEEFFSDPVSFVKGKSMIQNSDCSSCHAMDTKSIGPSYMDIARRYAGQQGKLAFLANKIIEGGNGNWGEKLMAGHPQHTLDETTEMTRYILSLADGQETGPTIQGTLTFDRHLADSGVYLMSIRYTDKGAGQAERIDVNRFIEIRPPWLEAEAYDFYNDVQQQRPNGGEFAYVSNFNNGSYIGYQSIDLTSIRQLEVQARAFNGGILSVRMDSPDGVEIGTVSLPPSQQRWRAPWVRYTLSIQSVQGIHDLYFVVQNEEESQWLAEIDKVVFKK
ncbi:MAG: PQQ-dependent sugar dehydrogenase [Cyclobacteriaceae bacterium]|nr:PQQ-dependent sugar dehydrogenase [Cyclobacteriaceae bacterium]